MEYIYIYQIWLRRYIMYLTLGLRTDRAMHFVWLVLYAVHFNWITLRRIITLNDNIIFYLNAGSLSPAPHILKNICIRLLNYTFFKLTLNYHRLLSIVYQIVNIWLKCFNAVSKQFNNRPRPDNLKRSHPNARFASAWKYLWHRICNCV